MEGKMYPYQRWNEIRMPRRGCARGTADVYHKSHCPPLTEFVEPPSPPPPPPPAPYPAYAKGERGSERQRARERATRATRCKTLPVNFIALGTSSYTSTCTTRHLTYLPPGQEPLFLPFNPSAFAYTLGRESDRGNIQTYARTHTRTAPYIVVIACVHTGRAAARVFTTDGG